METRTKPPPRPRSRENVHRALALTRIDSELDAFKCRLEGLCTQWNAGTEVTRVSRVRRRCAVELDLVIRTCPS